MNGVMKAATSIGAVTLVLSGVALAAPPSGFNVSGAANANAGQFDAWKVDAGTISIIDMDSVTGLDQDCPPGYTCTAAVTGNGFYQRQITRDSDSASFFQTIIVDNDVTAANAALDGLEFADESFVQTGNNQGLADKQRVSKPEGTVSFASRSLINSGWGAVNDKNVDIFQNVVDTANDGFRTDFFFDQTGSSASPTQARMKISGEVGMTAADDQYFVLVQMQGDYVSGATTSVTLPGDTGGTLVWTQDTTPGVVGVEGPLPAGTEGDKIKATWVGQTMTAVNQVFGFTSFTNEAKDVTDDPTESVSHFSLTDPAAEAWDTNVWGVNSLLTDGNGF